MNQFTTSLYFCPPSLHFPITSFCSRLLPCTSLHFPSLSFTSLSSLFFHPNSHYSPSWPILLQCSCQGLFRRIFNRKSPGKPAIPLWNITSYMPLILFTACLLACLVACLPTFLSSLPFIDPFHPSIPSVTLLFLPLPALLLTLIYCHYVLPSHSGTK